MSRSIGRGREEKSRQTLLTQCLHGLTQGDTPATQGDTPRNPYNVRVSDTLSTRLDTGRHRATQGDTSSHSYSYSYSYSYLKQKENIGLSPSIPLSFEKESARFLTGHPSQGKRYFARPISAKNADPGIPVSDSPRRLP